MNTRLLLPLILLLLTTTGAGAQGMMYCDNSRQGVPFAKDPHVVRLQGRYLMYYSIPPRKGDMTGGWNIGIAESRDLTLWNKVGEITPQPGADYEKNGLCAPGALVRDGVVHLFYQTYGNGRKDAVCHATSTDGINFVRDSSNPIFAPTGDWTCGRAIDAEVCFFRGKYFLYFATRDPDFKVQQVGVATAPAGTDFSRGQWTQVTDSAILAPQLPWERKCIEAPSIAVRGKRMYMFYAGAYNNEPQQIGVAGGGAATASTGKGFRTNLSSAMESQESGMKAKADTPTSSPTKAGKPISSTKETARKGVTGTSHSAA